MQQENKSNKYGRYQCPCCGYYTFNQPADNTFQICDVCYWEDDGIQLSNPNYHGGANAVSLKEAQQNFKLIGACEALFLKHVRKPVTEELPD